MAKTGQKMVSSATGETFIFLQTAADTNGELLQMECIIEPGGGAKAAPIHIHPKQEETFHIIEGRLRALVDNKEMFFEAGESLCVPAGTAHTWNNPDDETLRFICELRPALRWEEIFETLCAVSAEGKLGKNGQASPLQMAVVFNAYQDHLHIAGIPAGVQKAVFALLAPVGKLLGHTESELYQSADAEVVAY